MPRYVDADKTLDLMWNALYKYEDEDEKKNGLDIIRRSDVQNGFGIAHKVVVDALEEDVVPVIHAHWIEHPEYSIVCNCSNCGVSVRGTTGENYCFNCGAKMDEE